ncbi:MAG: hypothetical protein QME96_09640, partial [Myxococcota bacterium]|nr:hypothetical protein [Myxococcota bacterium]
AIFVAVVAHLRGAGADVVVHEAVAVVVPRVAGVNVVGAEVRARESEFLRVSRLTRPWGEVFGRAVRAVGVPEVTGTTGVGGTACRKLD